MHLKLKFLFLFLFLFLSLLASVSFGQKQIGTNSGFVQDWAPEWVLSDVSKLTRDWITESGSAQFDSRGYPTSVNGKIVTYFAWDLGKFLPNGKYVLTWDGQADLKVLNQPGFTINYIGSHRIEVDVNPVLNPNGFRLELTNVNEFDNFHFWMPEHENTSQIFNTYFINTLSVYNAGYRTMNWQAINNSTQVSWDDRAKVSDWTWTRRGFPPEIINEFIKVSPNNVWINVPAKVDDNYIIQFANIIKDSIKPGQKVYIEYSNEVWNSGFSQYTWVGNTYGTGDNPTDRSISGYAFRATEVMKIFTQVVGPESLIRVLSAQADSGKAWWLDQEAIRADLVFFDAFAIAPYFQGQAAQSSTDPNVWGSKSLDEWFIDAYDSLNRVQSNIVNNRSIANKYGKILIGYEGGSHYAPVTSLQKNTSSYVNKTIAFHRDSRFSALQKDYLEIWETFASGPMFLFENVSEYNKHGSWGHLEYLTQSFQHAPKMKGNILYLIDYNNDDILDNGDIQTFLSLYFANDDKADINQDGFLDNGDIELFVKLFNN